MNIPKTFTDMARFNASVMGVGDRVWFADMLYAMVCWPRLVAPGLMGSSKKSWFSYQGRVDVLDRYRITAPFGCHDMRVHLACLGKAFVARWYGSCNQFSAAIYQDDAGFRMSALLQSLGGWSR